MLVRSADGEISRDAELYIESNASLTGKKHAEGYAIVDEAYNTMFECATHDGALARMDDVTDWENARIYRQLGSGTPWLDDKPKVYEFAKPVGHWKTA